MPWPRCVSKSTRFEFAGMARALWRRAPAVARPRPDDWMSNPLPSSALLSSIFPTTTWPHAHTRDATPFNSALPHRRHRRLRESMCARVTYTPTPSDL